MSTATQGRAREHKVRDDLEARFFARLRQDGDCWIWTGPQSDSGYGLLIVKSGGRQRNIPAHRWSYEFLRADIPEGLVIDHLCRVRACVNPWHLEPVTIGVNTRRGVSWNGSKTHCKRGHELSGENLGHQNGNHRYCRTCKRATDARRWAS